MICFNKEKFYESQIFIERQLIKDENDKGLFFINHFESDKSFECDISFKTGSIVENDEVKSNFMVHKKSSGINGGAIAVLPLVLLLLFQL